MRRYINLVEGLTEAPIDNFHVVGNVQPLAYNKDGSAVWGSPDRGSYGAHSFTKTDERLLKSEKGVQKIRNAFQRTPFVFDVYVMLDHEKRRYEDWTNQELERVLGREFDLNGKINLVYISNVTGQYNPMTAWIIAHRIAHMLQVLSHGEAWTAERTVWDQLVTIWNAVFEGPARLGHDPLSPANPEHALTQFANVLFTMRSARNGEIQNPLDVFGEALAQWLLTGRFKFTRMEEWDLGRVNKKYFLYRDNPPKMKPYNVEEVNALLEQGEQAIADALEKTFQSMVGRVLKF